eukprot:1343461-Rhodomonas_salina.1
MRPDVVSGTDLAYAAVLCIDARESLRLVPGTISLSAYARAMRCPGLIAYEIISLRACYAMSGTEMPYRASCLRDVRY